MSLRPVPEPPIRLSDRHHRCDPKLIDPEAGRVPPYPNHSVLCDDDIELIARRVAELLGERTSNRLRYF